MSRSGVSPRRSRCCAVAAFAALLACGGPYHLASDAPKSRDLERLVLLPLNFESAPNPVIAPGTELVREKIRSYLEGMGYEVLEPRMSTTLALWRKCTEDVGGIDEKQGRELSTDRFELARSDLVRRTFESLPADGAVAGTVMLREGRYSGRSLHWDDVTRPVRVDNESNYPVLALRGKGVGISLRTTVFDRQGRKVFERTVGLEVVTRYEADHSRLRSITRTDLFQDAALLEDSISLSFRPWLDAPAVAGR